jgi:hypothetical protein
VLASHPGCALDWQPTECVEFIQRSVARLDSQQLVERMQGDRKMYWPSVEYMMGFLHCIDGPRTPHMWADVD